MMRRSVWLMVVLAACNGGDVDTDTDAGTDTGTDTDTDTEAPIAASVGGTVSGLFNGPVVLQINGGDDVTVASDGEFQFDDAVVVGDDFDVTVAQAPSGQTCVVNDGAGSVDGDVDGIAVECACDVDFGYVSGASAFGVDIGSRGQLSVVQDVNGQRGVSPTPAWELVCGGESTRILDVLQTAPDSAGTPLAGSQLRSIQAGPFFADTATALVGWDDNGATSQAMYLSHAPDFEPELALYTGLDLGIGTLVSLDDIDPRSDGLAVVTATMNNGSFDYSVYLTVDSQGTVEVLFDPSSRVATDDGDKAICVLGQMVTSAAGYSVAPVGAYNNCFARGFSFQFNSVLVLPDDGEPYFALAPESVDPVLGELDEVDRVRVDDAGIVTMQAQFCESGAPCVGISGLYTLDPSDDSITPLAERGDTLVSGYVHEGVSEYHVADTGEIAAVLTQYDAACARRGICVTERTLMVYDGSWNLGFAVDDGVEGYEVGFDIMDALATSGGGAVAVVDLYDAMNVREPRSLMCYDPTEGASIALAQRDGSVLGDTFRDVGSVRVNAAGQFAAVVRRDSQRTGVVTGECP